MRVLPECSPPALFKSSPVWSYLLRSGVGLVDHAGSYPRPEWPQDDAEYRALSSHLRTARRSRRRAREPFGTTLGGKNVLTQSSVEKHLQQALDQGVSLATARDNSNRSSIPIVDMSSQGVLSHESARIIKLRALCLRWPAWAICGKDRHGRAEPNVVHPGLRDHRRAPG